MKDNLSEKSFMQQCKDANLSVEETQLIHWRLIGEVQPLTYSEIGQRLKMTDEGARVKIKKIMRKLAHG